MRLALSPSLLLALSALFWGGHWVVARAIFSEATPVSLSFWRWLTATAVLAPFAWRPLRADARKLRLHWKFLVLASLTGTGIYNAIGYVGIQHTTATNALLIQSIMPALIPLIAFVLVRERIGPAAIAGFAVSCSGVLAIASRLDAQALLALELNRGDLWLLLNAALWALYTVCLRWKPTDLHPLSFLLAIMLLGVIQLLPLYALDYAAGGRVTPGVPFVLGVLYLGIFPSMLSYVMWNRAVGEVGSARAGPFIYLVPVFGTAMAYAFLDERLQLYHLVGVVLILAGIRVSALDKPRPPV